MKDFDYEQWKARLLEEVKARVVNIDGIDRIFLQDDDFLRGKREGEVHDIIRYAPTGEIVTEIYQGFNLVVDAASKLIAALLKNHAGHTGFGYWEVGSGNVSWSNTSPPSPVQGDVGLLAPLARKAINSADVKFIDGSNIVQANPTNRLEVYVKFETGDANGEWREFAIWGGNATSTVGTGIMFNRKTHGLITKTSLLEVERTIRFTV